MRIIAKKQIRLWALQHASAAPSLHYWLEITKKATWKTIAETRQSFPSADPMKVTRGTVTVFNISGNDFRLITALHYNRQIIHTMKFMPHAEYSKDRWKDEF